MDGKSTIAQSLGFKKNKDGVDVSVRELKELYEKFNTEEMISLPILPSESAYYEYDYLGCADNLCKNFIKNSKDDVNMFECYFCKKHIEMPKKNILLIDLRINPDTKSETTTFDEGTIKLLSNKQMNFQFNF